MPPAAHVTAPPPPRDYNWKLGLVSLKGPAVPRQDGAGREPYSGPTPGCYLHKQRRGFQRGGNFLGSRDLAGRPRRETESRGGLGEPLILRAI